MARPRVFQAPSWWIHPLLVFVACSCDGRPSARGHLDTRYCTEKLRREPRCLISVHSVKVIAVLPRWLGGNMADHESRVVLYYGATTHTMAEQYRSFGRGVQAFGSYMQYTAHFHTFKRLKPKPFR